MQYGHGEKSREAHRLVHRKSAKYALLLPLILLNLVVLGFEDYHPFIRHITIWLAVATLALALYASDVGRMYLLAVASLALIAAAAVKPAVAYSGWFAFVAVAIFSTATALAPIAILRKVQKEFVEEGVDAEVILGALCAYLYIGFWFALINRSVAIISNASFFAQPGAESMLNHIYFSFITLTSTGYGDLTPAYGPGRMLAAIEAIIGQLYLVSVVAIVVSAYSKRRQP